MTNILFDPNASRESAFTHTRQPAFWESIYEADIPPWDLGGPSPTLDAALGLGLLLDPATPPIRRNTR